MDSLRVNGLDESLSTAQNVLNNFDGPAKNIVVINAAASLLIAGRVTSLKDGVAMASEALASGKARGVAKALSYVTKKGMDNA